MTVNAMRVLFKFEVNDAKNKLNEYNIKKG